MEASGLAWDAHASGTSTRAMVPPLLASMRSQTGRAGLSGAAARTMVWSPSVPFPRPSPAPRKPVAARGEAAFRDVLTTDSEAC